ncbi:MAG: class II aldolase/adducin family protein [Planctomyces sp.]|nr:class II aldolase/adducin family protein [Planctomyces sp.]
MTDLAHPRDAILATMDRIYRYRMTTTSGGNISLRDEAGDVWITPARLDKGALRRTDVVRVRASGDFEGDIRPSSELPFHQAIYAARPDIRAIVHAHPAALVAFSMARMTPETRLFPQSWHVCGEPGFAPYALPGSAKLGENIAEQFRRGYNAVVLENHGVVVGAGTLAEAFQRFEALEFVAQTAIRARTLGEARALSPKELDLPQQRRLDFRGVPRAAPSSNERELRRQVSEFVRRGCQQRLLISTEGSFSASLSAEEFLITPSQQDRFQVGPQDLVWVRGDDCELGRQPSRASRCHQAIYAKHPDVQAICFAHPVHATAFSVTGTSLDSRTIPESYIVLRDIARIPFGLPYQNGAAVADLVSARQPAALLDHDGVLVLGASVLDAFDRLEVMEATAEALIFSRRIGEASPMPDRVIAELRDHFLKD